MKSNHKLIFVLLIVISSLIYILLFRQGYLAPSEISSGIYLIGILLIALQALTGFYYSRKDEQLKTELHEKLDKLENELYYKDHPVENVVETEDSKNNEKINAEEINNINEKIANEIEAKSDEEDIIKAFINTLANSLGLVQAQYFKTIVKDEDYKILKLKTSFAYYNRTGKIPEYEFGDGIIGQVAIKKEIFRIKNVPEGYINVVSGLGNTEQGSVIIYPILDENEKTIGIIEIASFSKFPTYIEELLKVATKTLSAKLPKLEKPIIIEKKEVEPAEQIVEEVKEIEVTAEPKVEVAEPVNEEKTKEVDETPEVIEEKKPEKEEAKEEVKPTEETPKKEDKKVEDETAEKPAPKPRKKTEKKEETEEQKARRIAREEKRARFNKRMEEK